MARVKTPAEGGGAVRGRRSARPARKQGSNVVVAKSGSGNDGGTVEDPGKIALFATPVRVELVTAIQALGGAATVAQLAIQLGRPADGLYYHLRALVRGGLLREAGGDNGRSYQLTVPEGQSLRLRYRPGATANARAVAKVVASMSRLAQRDFQRALAQPQTVVEGAARELWAGRLRGWVDARQLAEVNRLLQRIADLLLSTRPDAGGKLIALHWALAPLSAQPMRRAASRREPRRG